MRTLFLILLIGVLPLFANPLKGLDTHFSKQVQRQLKSSLNGSTLTQKIHNSDTYTIHKGWNSFITPKNGIDVIESFKNTPDVKFVVTYDFQSNYWAGFTLDQAVLKDIKEMLLLRSLEPHIAFFILSAKDMTLKIKSSKMNGICQKVFDDAQSAHIYDSGFTKEPTSSTLKDISINSRYASHTRRGFYDDTRVVLIYRQAKTKAKATQKYGPAEPMVMLHYAPIYENKRFYIYDYLEKKCYRGIFPSKRVPPFPVLEVVKK